MGVGQASHRHHTYVNSVTIQAVGLTKIEGIVRKNRREIRRMVYRRSAIQIVTTYDVIDNAAAIMNDALQCRYDVTACRIGVSLRSDLCESASTIEAHLTVVGN